MIFIANVHFLNKYLIEVKFSSLGSNVYDIFLICYAAPGIPISVLRYFLFIVEA